MDSLPDNLHSEDIIWRGKPQPSLVLLCSIVYMMIIYTSYVLTSYALNFLFGIYMPYWLSDIKSFIFYSLAFFVPGILAYFTVLSFRVLFHEYIITSHDFYIKKRKKWIRYYLKEIHEINMNHLIPKSNIASTLEIFVQNTTPRDKGKAVWAWSKKRDRIYLWLPKNALTVKKALEHAVKAARMPELQ
jgi:hypothetical protein